MENPIRVQALLLAATFLTGVGLGALYDLLRVAREKCPFAISLAADIFFCGCFAGALFLLGMGPGAGSLRFYFPPLTLCGALVWFAFFGALTRSSVRKAQAALSACLAVPTGYIKNVLREQKKMIKKDFSFLLKRFTIGPGMKARSRPPRGTDPDEGGNSSEAETFQYFYEAGDPGGDRLRAGHVGWTVAKRAGRRG